MKKAFLLILPAAVLLAMALDSQTDAATLPKPGGPPRGPGGPPRTITVIGDSFAVGIAGGLRGALQGTREVRSSAKVGAPTTEMPTAPDDGSDVIVSAGTNDLAGIPSAEGPARDLALSNIVDRVVRILDVFAIGAPVHGGRLFYFLPHSKMGGQLGKNVEDFDRLLVGPLDIPTALEKNPSLDYARAMSLAGPAASDHIHTDGHGYSLMAEQAIRFFNT